MKYLVMECHLSYAILLDEDGRFIKAANLHYEPGQTVTDIIEMKESEPIKKTNYKWITGLATAAACFVLLLSTFLNNQTYASVFMVINPEVRIDVNRKNMVVGLEGVNEDGQDLIKGYFYKKKSLEPVMDELVDRAIDMGYLSDGEQITLTLDAKDDEWVVTTGTELQTHIDDYLTDKMSVTIEVSNPAVPHPEPESDSSVINQTQTIVIPTSPEDDGDSAYGISDYGDTTTTDDGSSNYGNDDEGSSNYDDDVNDSDSNYDDTANNTDSDDTSAESGVSSYDDDDGADDGSSSYSITQYEEPLTDNTSNYEEAIDSGDSNYHDTSSSDDDSDDSDDDDSSESDSNYE